LAEFRAAHEEMATELRARLNEAGIFTYAQLAESTPEELRRILGEGVQAAGAEEWIEQARELVE